MQHVIYFLKDESKAQAYVFVDRYIHRKWYRREMIRYSLCFDKCEIFTDEDTERLICARIKRDFPKAKIFCEDFTAFKQEKRFNMFWVISRWRDDSVQEYYNGEDQWHKPTYTTEIGDMRMMMSSSSAKETLRMIQHTTRDRVWVMPVYINLTNELLSPCMMITCTSKGNDQTKYFRKLDGNRLRLVSTSEAATKFAYENAIQMWEFLKTHNKNFLYAVLPVFKDNVNCKDIENYMRENRISRMIVMDMQLKFLNR